MLQDGDYFLAIGDQLRIAHELRRNEDGSITADLYRNPRDYGEGRVMERAFTYWRYLSPAQ